MSKFPPDPCTTPDAESQVCDPVPVPCPCCGKAADIYPDDHFDKWVVYCPNPDCCCIQQVRRENRSSSIDAWNRWCKQFRDEASDQPCSLTIKDSGIGDHQRAVDAALWLAALTRDNNQPGPTRDAAMRAYEAMVVLSKLL